MVFPPAYQTYHGSTIWPKHDNGNQATQDGVDQVQGNEEAFQELAGTVHKDELEDVIGRVETDGH